MTKLSAVGMLALLGTSAHASSFAIATSGEPAPPPFHQVDARVGMLAGGSDVGDADGGSVGLATGIGYRVGDTTLRGTFDYYTVGDGADEALQRKGRASRFGAAARYSIANTGTDGTLALDFWGELGVGYEHTDWRQGGIVNRPSVELAFGFDLGGRGDRDPHDGKRREVGYYMALRAFVAQAPGADMAIATCGGPCDAASTPSRTDLSMFADFGIHFGH